jgi:hypothetical protein
MTNQVGKQDAEIIQAPALDFSKYTTWAAGIGTLGTAVVALVQSFSGVNPAIVDGALAVVAVGLLAIAFVTATDVASRAYATAAQLKASLPSDSSQKKTSALKANGTNALATIGTPFSVQVHGRGNEPFRVLAIRYDADAKSTIYLVARQNERPMWIKEDEVQATLS